jgi:hypothetical protein
MGKATGGSSSTIKYSPGPAGSEGNLRSQKKGSVMIKMSLTIAAVCATLLCVSALDAKSATLTCAQRQALGENLLDRYLTLGQDLCTSDLTTHGCDASVCSPEAFPATGQTRVYAVGDDGTVEAGAALSYTDNGDGTITDNNTKLMWEKKDQDSGLHNYANTYP